MMNPTTFLRSSLLAALAAAIAASGCNQTPTAPSTGGYGAGAPQTVASPAQPGPTKFGATLSGAAEVPPNSSTGSGKIEASLNQETRLLSWKLSYSGLTGPATAAHFHGPAMPGANAGVALPFPGAANPTEGSATLTPAQVADLVAGKWYANVHTAANPGGEIRGQVTAR